MKKNRHKYFRNKRYKQKLETKYNNNNKFIKFVSNEKATNIKPYYYWRTGEEIEDWYWDANRNQWCYYKRPDVPYTILEDYWNKDKNYKTWLKRYRNKQFRRYKPTENFSQKAFYKKAFEYWWDIY